MKIYSKQDLGLKCSQLGKDFDFKCVKEKDIWSKKNLFAPKFYVGVLTTLEIMHDKTWSSVSNST